MQFLHNQLLKSAATDGMSQIMKYGGIGAAVGGTYGAFSDTGTMMEGAFKGGLLGGGGAAGLKYFGNQYATGFNRAAEAFIKEATPALDSFASSRSLSLQAQNVNEVFNRGLNAQESGKQLSSNFNSRFFSIGKEANFGDNIDTTNAVKLLSDFNKRSASLNKAGTVPIPGMEKYSMNQFGLGLVKSTGERDRTIGSIYNSGSYSTSFWEQFK